jgi:hypothetical protein
MAVAIVPRVLIVLLKCCIWLGISVENITFDEETQCDVDEIRELLSKKKKPCGRNILLRA